MTFFTGKGLGFNFLGLRHSRIRKFASLDFSETGYPADWIYLLRKGRKVGKVGKMQDTVKKTAGHALSKDEGLTNGGNAASSDVPEEMTEVCCYHHQCVAKKLLLYINVNEMDKTANMLNEVFESYLDLDHLDQLDQHVTFQSGFFHKSEKHLVYCLLKTNSLGNISHETS